MKQPFILASRSPRRMELLKSIGLPFIVDEPDFDESMSSDLLAHDLVLVNAIGKARSVLPRHKTGLILGVDTVGALDDHILEKPKDREDAIRILKLLSGRTHEVYSGLCLIDAASGHEETAIERTKITFRRMSRNEIEIYVDSGEPMDKAAAYAAQGLGAIFVKRFDGDYFNVVGLPLARLQQILKRFDIDLIDIVELNAKI